jgi:hypothetical protein
MHKLKRFAKISERKNVNKEKSGQNLNSGKLMPIKDIKDESSSN